MPSVVLLGTLDTKGTEYAFLGDRVREAGCDVILVDAGVLSERSPADISADDVAAAAGEDRAALAKTGDRGPAVLAMARGATIVVRRLFDEGRLDGILGLGGSGGSSIIATAMQSLPVGVPKLLVSTMALRRHAALRRHLGHRDDALGRRHRRDQRPVREDPVERRSGDGGHGQDLGTFVSQIPPQAAHRRHDVRRHHPLRHESSGDPREQGLRGPRLPRDRCRRAHRWKP